MGRPAALHRAARRLRAHAGRTATGDHRRPAPLFVTLLSRAADDAGLPADPEFRAAIMGYAEWGTRLAVQNSQPAADAAPHAARPALGLGRRLRMTAERPASSRGEHRPIAWGMPSRPAFSLARRADRSAAPAAARRRFSRRQVREALPPLGRARRRRCTSTRRPTFHVDLASRSAPRGCPAFARSPSPVRSSFLRRPGGGAGVERTTDDFAKRRPAQRRAGLQGRLRVRVRPAGSLRHVEEPALQANVSLIGPVSCRCRTARRSPPASTWGRRAAPPTSTSRRSRCPDQVVLRRPIRANHDRRRRRARRHAREAQRGHPRRHS